MQRRLTLRCLAATVGLVLAAGTEMSHAGYVSSLDPAPSFSGNPAWRARNGNTGFEAVLFTPANPAPTGVPLNPNGAPIWNTNGNAYGVTFFDFQYTYNAATGTATLGIDFNHDTDYLDAQELASSVSPTLAGYGFEYVNLFLDGNGTVGVTINDFTLNGTNFGTYSNFSATDQNNLFKHNGGSYDILATGSFTFSGDGGSELPRFWLQTGSRQEVPEPASLALFGSAGLMGLILRRRKA